MLMVTPRFGAEVVGGAEQLVRGLALRAAAPDDVVEVATTCAVDHERWENVHPPGSTIDAGLRVHRFPVGERDATRHGELMARLTTEGRLTYAEELDLMATSVWSPELQAYLDREGGGFDLILFAPYLFGTSFWGAQACPERSVLIPCLHDEPPAHTASMRALLGSVRGCVFNTAAEERLARGLADIRSGGVVGLGFDPPEGPAPAGFAARHGLGDYVVYVGRIEEGKGVDRLARQVADYRERSGRDLKLVLVGRGSYRPSGRLAAGIVRVGYLDEDEKRSALAEAVALANPSRLESLSIVTMEAWLEGTPVIVDSGCDVLRDHVEASGGGLAVSEAGFGDAIDRLVADRQWASGLGAAGRAYVHDRYGWPRVAADFQRVTREIAAT